MDTYSLQDINLRIGDFEYDPDLEIYDEIYNDDKLLFFEVNEGVYLAIDKIEHNEKNAIYYFGNIEKETKMDFASPSFRDISNGYALQLEGFAGKLGV